MITKFLLSYVVASCVLLCLAALDATASSEEPTVVEPLTPVTQDVLTTLRAQKRVEEFDYQLVQTERGPMPLSDGLAAHGAAIRALQEAFHIPVCLELVYPNESLENQPSVPRFPFVIESNERLVDSLAKLEKNSNGFVQWRQMHERIVLVVGNVENKGETYIMDRSVHIEIEAGTLLEALQLVESTYNKQYADVPLLIRPLYVRLDLQGPPSVSGETGKFVLRTDGTLRDIVLALLDQMEDTSVCYTLAASSDAKERPYFALDVRKNDAPEYASYESEDEASVYGNLLRDSSRRLDEYLEQAAKAAAGTTKP